MRAAAEGPAEGSVGAPDEVEGLALLPPVLQLLADPAREVTDDTCLEKLLDWLTQEISRPGTGGEMLRHVRPCVLEFLGRVSGARADVAPCVLSLALRLAGLLGSSDAGFERLQALGLLEDLFVSLPREAGVPWREAAVRCGWLVGLASVLRHEPAFRWLCRPGNVEVVLCLWKDSSMFVANAANQLLARLLVWGGRVGAAPPNWSPPSPPTDHNPVLALVDGPIRSSLRGGDGEDGVRRALRLLEAWAAGGVGAAAGDARASGAENAAAEEKDDGRPHGASWDAVAALWLDVRACWEGGRVGEREARTVQALLDLHLVLLRSSEPPTDILCLSALLQELLESQHAAHGLSLAAALARRPGSSTAAAHIRTVLLPLVVVPPDAESPGAAAWALRRLSTRAGAVGLLCHAMHLLGQLAAEERLLGRAEAAAATVGVSRTVALSLGLDGPRSPAEGQLARFLIGCSRVQRVGLDCMAALATPTAGEDDLGCAVVKVLLRCLSCPDADPSVIGKVFWALQCWLDPERGLALLTSHAEDAVDLGGALALRLADARWEVRDSALEFLAAGVSERRPQGSLLAPWLARHGLHAGAAWDRLSDAQAYVRASAVAALAVMALNARDGGEGGGSWTSALGALHLTEDDFLRRLCDILSGDPECFPRRAACRALATLLRAGGSLQVLLLALAGGAGAAGAALRAATRDPDWEVKVSALEFWQEAAALLSQEGALVGAAAPAVAVLAAAVQDCDRPAASRACVALAALVDAGVVPGVGGGTGGDAMGDVRRLDLAALRCELERRSDYVQSGPASLLRDILASGDGALLDGADCY